MKRGSAIFLAAAAMVAAGAAGAQEREPVERAAQQVVVNVNAPAPAGAECGQPVAYRDCGCAPQYGTAVTVLDTPFQPGAMYFVNQPPVRARHGRWR